MPIKVKTPKWILYRHTSNWDLVKTVAVNLIQYSNSGISKEEKVFLNERLRKLKYYKERNPELPLDAINHKINTLAYFMFGYKYKNQFLFSHLGDLMIDNFDDSKTSPKIFLAQLFGIQFPHPHGANKVRFKLFPYRLIFKLLTEKRLNGRLYSTEYTLILAFVESIDRFSYENLINEILALRAKSYDEIIKKLDSDIEAHVNAYYEWDYYITKLFQDAGILVKTVGKGFHKMIHGKDTPRTIKSSYVELNEHIRDFCLILLNNYTPFKKPIELNEGTRLSTDITKEIYSFFPQELIKEINLKTSRRQEDAFELMKSIEFHSENPEKKSPDQFEILLTKALNYFINVDAERRSGPGQTDIECLYIDDKSKFSVDAKSTQNKLTAVNPSRFKNHRRKIGAKYTIVITPRYTPAVLSDIEEDNAVIILANTLTEYLRKIIMDKNDNDYTDIHNLILQNFGCDISDEISALTFNKYASVLK